MIKCEKGLAQFDGNALELSAETTTLLKGLLETYKRNESSERDHGFHNYLIKSIMYAFSRQAHDMGYDINFSEKDLESFDRIYRDVYEGDD